MGCSGAAALLFSGLALIINCVSLATDYWLNSDDLGVNQGLWRYCVDGLGCSNLELLEQSDDFKATQAAMILAVIFNVGACAVILIFLCVPRVNQDFMKSASVIAPAIAAFWNVVALFVFAFSNEPLELAWSYGLGIISTVLELLTALMAALTPQSIVLVV